MRLIKLIVLIIGCSVNHLFGQTDTLINVYNNCSDDEKIFINYYFPCKKPNSEREIINRVDQLNNKIGSWLVFDSLKNLLGTEYYDDSSNYYSFYKKIVAYNNTNLNIKILYDNIYQTRFRKESKLTKGKFQSCKYYLDLGGLKVMNSKIIVPSRVYGHTPQYLYFTKDTITVDSIIKGKEMPIKYYRSGSIDWQHIDKWKEKEDIFWTSFGKIAIKNDEPVCDDSGYHNVVLNYKGKMLKIIGLLNVTIFEFDIDSDDEKELFIFVDQICEGAMRLYMIKNNS